MLATDSSGRYNRSESVDSSQSQRHEITTRLQQLSDSGDDRVQHVIDFLWSEHKFSEINGGLEFAKVSTHSPTRYEFDIDRIRPETLERCLKYLE